MSKDLREQGVESPIRMAVADGVARIAIDRPTSRNSLNIAAMGLLASTLERAGHRDDVRCIVLTGTGEAFCSGADLSDVPGPDAEVDRHLDMMHVTSRVIGAVTASPVPVIAMVRGPAAGVGASLALACDLVVASCDAYFLLPFAGIGLLPDGGATVTVAASIGRARAMRLALRRERLDAGAAFDSGLIAATCDPGDLEATVDQWAQDLANGPSAALSSTKAAINASTLAHLPEALARETREQARLLGSQDFREGVSAFLERRRPVFD